jgi:hypothetical protein
MNRIPDETAANMRSLFFSMFGGPDKLDCWLNDSADELASMGLALPAALALPLPLQTLVLRPREVLDTLLDKLHGLKVWEYDLKRERGLIKVYDRASGHLVEEAGIELLPVLRAKYGDNLREE